MLQTQQFCCAPILILWATNTERLCGISSFMFYKRYKVTGFRTTSQKNAKDDYGWWANLAYSRLFSYWTDFGDISERISKLFPRRFKYWTFRRRNKLLPSIHHSVSKQFKLKTNTSFHLNQTIKLLNQMWMQLHWPSLIQHEQIKNQSHKSFFLNVTLYAKAFFIENAHCLYLLW